MSAVPNVAEPAAPTPKGRREWVPRAIFEAALILVGLLGAFALDEWQDTRARAERVETLVAAIRAELEANLRQHEEASAYNTEVADRIWDQAVSGVEVVPPSAYPMGLLMGPRLTSAAWVTAQNGTALGDVPIEQMLTLARIYEMQQKYIDDVNTLMNNLYALLLQPSDEARVDGLANPLRMGGVLRDFSSRGRQLVDGYRAALEQL